MLSTYYTKILAETWFLYEGSDSLDSLFFSLETVHLQLIMLHQATLDLKRNCEHFNLSQFGKHRALAGLPHLLLLRDKTKGNFSPAFDRFSPSGPPAVAQPACVYRAPGSFTNCFKTHPPAAAYLTYSQSSVCIAMVIQLLDVVASNIPLKGILSPSMFI